MVGRAVLGGWLLVSAASVAAAQVAPAGAETYEPRPAGTLTFTKDIAPIVFAHCSDCHRPGEAAPFPLLGHADVARHARQIAFVTEERIMPPWLPGSSDATFAGDRRLSIEEIGLIGQWAAEGAREGDPGDLPEPPEWTAGWQLGEPDLVVTMPAPYTLAADGRDVFRNFVLPTTESTHRYVRAVELRPGSPRVVHHAEIMLDTTRSSRRMDGGNPEPGFGSMDASHAEKPDGHLLGWTPGKVPFDGGSSGMAWSLPAGSDLVVQMHLLPSGKPEPVQVSIGLFFTDAAPERVPVLVRLGSTTIDIPAETSDYTIQDTYVLPVDVDLIGIYPHAHYVCKSMRFSARDPDGDERTLLTIPEWDFNWQDEYRYAEPVTLRRGTTLAMEYVYDNSEGNELNPNQPPERIVYGALSSDEMGDLWIQVLPSSADDAALLRADFARKDLAARAAGYEQAVRNDPQDAEAQFQLGVCRINQRRGREALECFQNAVALEPEHARAHFKLGLLFGSAGQFEAAVEHYEQVMSVHADSPETLVNLGAIYERLGEPAKAREHYDSALELEPLYSDALVNLGILDAREGHFASARSRLEAALEVEPGNAGACFNLANLLVAEKDLSGAAEYYERCVQANPTYPGAHFALGTIYTMIGDLDKAASRLTRAIELQPERSSAHFNLGNVRARQGQLKRAIEHYEHALSADPTNEAARQNLARAQQMLEGR